MMLEFIIISALVSTIIVWWKNRTTKLRHNIKSFPVLGVSYLFFGDKVAHLKAVQIIGQETNKQGGIIAGLVQEFMFPHSKFFSIPEIKDIFFPTITDPFLAEFVLKTCLDKDDITRFSRIATGNGTIFAPEATLGAKIQSQRNPDHPFPKEFAEGITLIATRNCQPWLHSDLIYKRLPRYSKLVKVVEMIKSFVNNIIKTKREVVRLECSNPLSINSTSSTILKILLRELQEKQGFTNKELQDEMITLLVAGTDTSAITTGFTLHMLARYPDVQDLVYNEIEEVSGRSTRPENSEDLAKLKYLDLVIKETLRLYPPGVVLLRKVLHDVELPSGLVLPEGCGIAVNVLAIHRNQEYWGPDAEMFRPESFLIPLKHPAQYIPFSTGPRNCIGYLFAMLSMKTAISIVLRRCKVTPAPTTQTDGGLPLLRLKFDFLLKDVENFTLCLDFRDNGFNKVE